MPSTSPTRNSLNAIAHIIVALDVDTIKADNGNKAAVTRIRVGLGKVMNLAKELRAEILAASKQ